MATEKKSKKGLIIVIFSLLLVGGGVGYYFWKKSQDEKEEKEKAEAEAKAKADANSGGGNTGGGNTGGGNTGGGNTGGGGTQNPIGDADAVKKFQDWLDIKYPTWLKGGKLNKGGGYGSFGTNTSNAWTTYGVDYKKVVVVPTGTTPTGTTPPLNQVFTNKIAPIWDNVNDFTPKYMAGAKQWMGTADLTAPIKTSNVGNDFRKFFYADDKKQPKYIAVENSYLLRTRPF